MNSRISLLKLSQSDSGKARFSVEKGEPEVWLWGGGFAKDGSGRKMKLNDVSGTLKEKETRILTDSLRMTKIVGNARIIFSEPSERGRNPSASVLNPW